MHGGDDGRPVTHGRRDALDRTPTGVPDGEDAGHRRLQRQAGAPGTPSGAWPPSRPRRRGRSRARRARPRPRASSVWGEPISTNSPGRLHSASPLPVGDLHLAQPSVAARVRSPRPEPDLDVASRRDLADEVVGHARRDDAGPHQQGDAAAYFARCRAACPAELPPPTTCTGAPFMARRLRDGGTVEDTCADEVLSARTPSRRQSTPVAIRPCARTPRARRTSRTRARRRRPREPARASGRSEVGAEHPRLVAGAEHEVAADPVRETRVVADESARAGLSPDRLTLDDQVLRPSEAAYIAAARPAGPAPTTTGVPDDVGSRWVVRPNASTRSVSLGSCSVRGGEVKRRCSTGRAGSSRPSPRRMRRPLSSPGRVEADRDVVARTRPAAGECARQADR